MLSRSSPFLPAGFIEPCLPTLSQSASRSGLAYPSYMASVQYSERLQFNVPRRLAHPARPRRQARRTRGRL
jgi:hypothetical protein